jgi:hypothetical protein
MAEVAAEPPSNLRTLPKKAGAQSQTSVPTPQPDAKPAADAPKASEGARSKKAANQERARCAEGPGL